MLVVVLFFLMVSSIIIFCLRRDRQTRLLLGLCLSFSCMFVGIIIYLAKTGGLQNGQKFLLFFDTRIQRRLSYMIFPLRALGYLIAVGRTLFPGFLLMIAVNYSMNFQIVKRKKWGGILWILPGITLILYFPELFLSIGRRYSGVQILLINMTIGWIALYVLAAFMLLVHEYRSITIPYCKRQFQYIMLFLISIGIMYLFYFRQDPIQVYQMYSAEYLRFGGALYSGKAGASSSRMILFSILTTLFGCFGFMNLRTYSIMTQEEENGEIMIQKQFDMASKGISVFVHGMKNQLLSNRVLGDKLKEELEKEELNREKIVQYVTMMTEINETMLKRMEELYRSIKSNALMLLPVDSGIILDKALERFHEKYPDVGVTIDKLTDAQVLADQSHLSEALNNLLANGYEAIQEAGREMPELKVRIFEERLYVTYEITDNGKGMSRQVQKKIFDPFYTSKNTNNNWGMGLYYVRQIVKNHFGMLRLESTEGAGTSFFVEIPKYGNQN